MRRRWSNIENPRSIGEVVPGHQAHLDAHDRERDGEQIPDDHAVDDQAIEKQRRRQGAADNPANARRATPSIEKAFVEHVPGTAHHHRLDSSLKMSSVETLNTRENSKASGRLGM